MLKEFSIYVDNYDLKEVVEVLELNEIIVEHSGHLVSPNKRHLINIRPNEKVCYVYDANTNLSYCKFFYYPEQREILKKETGISLYLIDLLADRIRKELKN